MSVSRRSLLAATAGGTAALMTGLPRPTLAEVAQAGGQAPGFSRFKVGDAEVTLVNDGVFQRPLEASFVKNAPFEQVQAALAEAFQPTDTLTIPVTTTVVNIGGRLVMFDAGTGGLLAPSAANWMANLKAAGYAPEQVDAIVVSHFHGDHIQGIRAKDGTANFPNATIYVPEAEWAFWMDDGQMSRAPEGMKGAFEGVRRVFAPVADQVVKFSGEKEVLPGITAMPAPGHTPGHSVFLVSSGDASLLVWSDTTNKPELFVRNPDWQVMFDMDGNQAVATRKRLLDMAASQRLPMTGYHFPFPAAGYIASGPDGYRFVPRFWMPA